MTSPRIVHLAGSLPGRDPHDAMSTALDILGPRLRTMPDGETGERSRWVGYQMARLEKLPAVYTMPGQGWDHDDDLPGHRIRDGEQLTTPEVERCLPLRDAFADCYGPFTALRAAAGRPGLAYQMGTPSPLDLACIMFGPDGADTPAIYDPILQATQRQVDDCRHHDVIFQVETVVAPFLTGYADDSAQPGTAAALAGRLADLPRRTEPGVRYGIHLCTSDLHHKPRTPLPDARALVLLANEIGRAWPVGCLEYIHLPVACGDIPPSSSPAWYEPLRDLDLPPGVRLAAGYAHETLDLSGHLRVRDMIEDRTGYPADVAAPCGLGRRPTTDQAHLVMYLSRDVADAD